MITDRAIASAVLTSVLFLVPMACSQAQAPITNTSTSVEQPDNVLFEQAMKAMKKSKNAEARTLLESLIRSYPDSDYVPRAKLFIGDAWYAEGAFRQAEMEYRDFITFFPNRPEVAETKLKIDAIQKKTKM